MSRIAFLLLVLVASASCNGGGIEMRPTTEAPVGNPAGDIDVPASPIKTLAIRPAYTKLVGLGKTVQLTACAWLSEGGDEVNAQDFLILPPPDDPLPVEWTTGNFGIASVDEKGLVTAVSSGDTFIHVHIDGKEAIARVIVEAESTTDPNIDISPTPL